jgi:peptidoglycan hydrolase-like protein with peptidoglycan-binding domain
MNFFDQIAKLQQDIGKYLTIHNNPHDTSKHDSFAEKLADVNPVLEKAAPSPPKTSIVGSVGKNGANDYNDVKLVQQLLGIKVDGHCGVKTNLAIRKFQRSLGFKKTDGRIDPGGVTWKNLSKKSTPTPEETVTETTSDSPLETNAREIKDSVGRKGINNLDDVILVQELLDLKKDGKCGLKTVGAIRDFQKANQLDNTGLIESASDTWNKLSKGLAPSTDDVADTPPVATGGSIKKSVGQSGNNASEDVLIVQNLLKNSWDYNVPTDGIITDKTIQAIRQFQYRFVGSIRSQDATVDPGGNTWKYLTGALKATMEKTDDGILGGAETKLEKEMAEFTKAFMGIQVEVNPGEFVAVRPPYHINLGTRLKRVLAARNANPKIKKIVGDLGFGGGLGKATPAQIEKFLEDCLAKNLVPDKSSQGMHEFLSKYGVSTDCSGLAIQAANFLVEGDMERDSSGQGDEEVKITNTGGIQQHPKVGSPKQLRAGDMMVNYKREGTSTYHVRILVDVDEVDGVIEFTTVESGSSSDLGDGGDGVGQRRWKFLDGSKFENVQILKGNDWQKGGTSDQAYTYVRMRQLQDLQDSEA